VIAHAVWSALDSTLGRSLGSQVASVGLALVAGTVVYLAACWLLRVKEMRPLLSLLGRLT
jgi:putative peptidoglycan lipid II flippase